MKSKKNKHIIDLSDFHHQKNIKNLLGQYYADDDDDDYSMAGSLTQTSYLSLISLILLVEKKLSCGEISAFHVYQLWGY